MKKAFAIVLISAGFFMACEMHQTLKDKQAEISTGVIDSNFEYTCPEIGWETQLPSDWHMQTKDETKKLNETGKKAIEESTGTSVDMSTLKELVNLKKDVFNSFLSTIEKYDQDSSGNYDKHNDAVDQLMKDTYTGKKIKFDSKEGNEKIDNIDFHTFEIKIYKPGSDEVLLNQKMYSALLKGYDFSMVMNYNNDADKQTLLKIIEDSKFK
jgi:hypothetical protein